HLSITPTTALPSSLSLHYALPIFSELQFGRNFKKASGFTPKFFARIVRFQTAMESFGLETQTMAEIALKCGYYDQSHFIHEFKEFSGYLPGEFFAGNTEGTEWLK